MTVKENHLGAGGSITDATSYVTASITPNPYRLVLCTVRSKLSAGPAAPTVTGCGLTWVQVDSQASGAQRITLFRAMGAAPSAGALTIDFGAVTQESCGWSITEFSGVPTTGSNGANAIVQAKKATVNTTDTGMTVTLDPFASANNATYGCIATAVGVTTISPGTGFTELAENSSDSRIEAEFRNDNDTSVDWTWSSSSGVKVAIAVEIAAVVLPTINVAYRDRASAALASVANNAGRSCNKPAATVDRDVMIAVVQVSNTTTVPAITPPAGWVELHQDLEPGGDGGSGGVIGVFRKVASGEGASYSFTNISGSVNNMSVVIHSYSGADVNNPTGDYTDFDDTASDTNLSTPSIDPTRQGMVMACVVGGASLTSFSAVDNAFTLRHPGSTEADTNMATADRPCADGVQTGGAVFTSAVANDNYGFQVAIYDSVWWHNAILNA